MLQLIKKIMPLWLLNQIRPLGHGFLALLAAVRYGFPSGKLVVIGITGTAGKSTTIQMLAHILNSSASNAGATRTSASKKCGYITTVGYFDGNSEHVNKHGMSMPSGSMIQRSLAEMLANGCKYAILEATSEGLAQNRHLGINFGMALFTNLAPAHIQSHGSFKHYMHAKGRLFQNAKIIGANLDDGHSDYFLTFSAKGKFGVTFQGAAGAEAENEAVSILAMQVAKHRNVTNIFMAESLMHAKAGASGISSEFVLRGQRFEVLLPGKFNTHNALLAVAAANILGVELSQSAVALKSFAEISGRMQNIKNTRGIKIFLDYAPEPFAMQNALETASQLPDRKQIIHVFGSTGGHRDAAKRFEFGEISARYADTIIITNDDVYNSDPEEIAKNVFEGVERAVEKKVKNILTILDRKEAITKAIEIAQPGDVILITGKGSEQFLVLPGNRRIAWDEKSVIEGLL